MDGTTPRNMTRRKVLESRLVESLVPLLARVPAYRVAVLLDLDAPELAALARGGIRFADAQDVYPSIPGEDVPGLAAFILAHCPALQADLALGAVAEAPGSGAVDTPVVDAFHAAAAGVGEDLEAGRPPDVDELLALWRRGVERLRARTVQPQHVN
jgi:hypothetical protein